MAMINIKKKAIRRIQNGGRLLTREDVNQPHQLKRFKEGDVLILSDHRHHFVAKAIYAKQNKGIGWVFTEYEDEYLNGQFIKELIQLARFNREHLFNNSDTTAFRVYNGEGDGLGGVTIDWYDGFIQINWYSDAIYQLRELFLEALIESLPKFRGIYETKRFKITSDTQAIEHTWGEVAPNPIIIKENGIHYAIHLGQEWMTGLFMDQREVRKYLKTQVKGKSILNLFSYTGAFSVAAAIGGASHTVSVDVANRSLERTKENFELNQIHPEQPIHEIRVMDVFDYIRYAKRHNLMFDFIVCDPPSFARTKKYIFSAEQDYKRLAEDLYDLTKPGGFCILSTNHSGYLKERFIQDMQEINRDKKAQWHLIQSFIQPEDYPFSADETSQYLKVLVFYKEA